MVQEITRTLERWRYDTDVQIVPIDHPFWRFYRLNP